MRSRSRQKSLLDLAGDLLLAFQTLAFHLLFGQARVLDANRRD